MKRITYLNISTRLLLKNLGFVYWHIIGVVLWLQGGIFAGGLAVAYLDDKPILDSLYLAFITALTVGYGDMVPKSGLSKLIAIGIGFIGIVFTGVVVAASLKALEMTIKDQTNSKL